MKTIKILLCSFLCLILALSITVVVVVKVFLPEEKIKAYIVDYAKNNLNREVSFDKLSFALIGINLENFKMSEKATFEDGTFIKADKFIIKVSPLPLLSKQVKISDVLMQSIEINITKDKEGVFNFDDIMKSFQSEESKKETEKNIESINKEKDAENNKNNFLLNVDSFDIKDANIKYTDEQINLYSSITNFNLSVKDFSFTEMFECETSFNVAVKQNKLDVTIPINSKIKTNINNFDMNKLLLNIEYLTIKYNDAELLIKGIVENINSPIIDSEIIIKNLSNNTLKDFFNIKTKFNADEITFKTKSNIDFISMKANIEEFNLVLPNSSSNLSGTMDWSKEDIEYNLKLNLDMMIDNFAKAIPQYGLKGRLKSNLDLNQNCYEGNISLINCTSNSDYGNVSNLNTDLYLKLENKTAIHKIDFSKFDIDSLIIKLDKFDIKYNASEISATGNITKKESSLFNLDVKAKNITDTTIKNFYESPIKFIIPSLNLNSQAQFNLKDKTANIEKVDITTPDSKINLLGKLNWNNKKTFVYNLSVNLDLLLDNIAKNFPEYKMQGSIKSKVNITNTNFSGTLNCNNLSFIYQDLATVSKLNLQATAKSKNNIIITLATGIFNDGNFKANATLMNKDIVLNLVMDKLKLSVENNAKTINNSSNNDVAVSTNTTTKNTNTNNSSKTSGSSQAQEFNYNVQANVSISEIDVPYLKSKKAILKTNLQSVTNSMTKTSGNFNLSISTGTITDIEKFAQENKLAKTFLVIFNSINNTSKKTKGIEYNKINCNLDFVNGVMTTNRVNLQLPITTVDVKGTVDFKTEKINLIIDTGLVAAMKMTGTLSEPKTSFDVKSTAISIFSNLFGSNSNTNKKSTTSVSTNEIKSSSTTETITQ